MPNATSKPTSPGSAPVGVRQQQRERTRQALLQAGRRLVAERGFDQTNVSDIAKAGGVAHGTVYYHFPDKKALLLALLGEFFEDARRLMEGWAGVTDTGPEAADRFLRAVVELLDGNREVARILRNESYHADPEIRGLVQGMFQYLVDRTRDTLESGIRLGSVRPLDTRIAALASIGSLKEIVFGLFADDEPLDLDHVIHEIATLQNYGIRPRRGSPGPADPEDPRRGSPCRT